MRRSGSDAVGADDWTSQEGSDRGAWRQKQSCCQSSAPGLLCQGTLGAKIAVVTGIAMKRVELVVEGRVQGVYYRGSTEEVARRLGVRGWVRNRDDGAVELVAEGEAVAVEALVEWCRRGPAGARVERVTERWTEVQGLGTESGFRVRR